MAAIKLFIWDGVLEDYTGGIACACATSAKSAREKILAQFRAIEKREPGDSLTVPLAGEPSRVLDFRDAAAYCYGGG